MYELSIIIPTFNSESYISNVLDSIVEQYDQFGGQVEVLVVDDGSSDRTLEVVEGYQSKFPIRKFALEHVGVSNARNAGINHAEGKYVTFVDSDDELYQFDYVSVKKMFTESVDLIYCDIDIEKTERIELNSQNKVSILEGIIGMSSNKLGWGIHSKFYRAEFLKNNDIEFDRKLRVAEDTIFNFDTIVNSKNLILSNLPIYKKNPSSSMHLFKKENLNNELYFRERFKNILENSSLTNYQAIVERLSITGFLFLVDRYFVPGILEKEFSFKEAHLKCREVFYEYGYAKHFNNAQNNVKFGKRLELLKSFLSKGNIRMAIVVQLIFVKLSGRNM